MIPYYSPNFGFNQFLKSLFVRKYEEKIINYFQHYSGKKYILITGSCRAALYLAYKVVGNEGEVITSPLTCKVAIDPIWASGNTPAFADICPDTLTQDISFTAKLVNRKTIAVQLIHFGGVPAAPADFRRFCDENELLLIEDCAQGLLSTSAGQNCGSFGDIACFSLIKNFYGIGGGILATDNIDLFNKASELQNALPDISNKLLVYRVVRNIIESKRNSYLGQVLYRGLVGLRNIKKEDKSSFSACEFFINRVSDLEKRIAAVQLNRINILNERRKKNGHQLFKSLLAENLMENDFGVNVDSSFTKFFIYHPKLNSVKAISYLNSVGIEAKHLEQKIGGCFQQKFVNKDAQNLKFYHEVHDKIISIPLYERMTKNEIEYIVKQLKKIIYE